MRKKKRKEVPTLELDDALQCARIWTSDGRIVYKFEGVRGSHAICKGALGKNRSIKVWCAAWLKKVQKKKVIRRKMRKSQQKRMHK